MLDQQNSQLDSKYGTVDPELRASSRWVVYKIESHEGRENCKVPYNARTGLRASTTNHNDWSSFQEAVAASPRYSGIGLVIGPPFIAVDLDKCRNPETGEIDAWARELIASLPPTYAEVSPSGRGIHLWFKGKFPKGKLGFRAADLEVYAGDRYFTVTGVPL